MRYAVGVLLGAILPGVIFLGASVIRLAGFGVTDPAILAGLWSLFLIWFFVSLLLLVVPLIAVYAARRLLLREWLAYEAGGLLFFTPFWFLLATEISGVSIVVVLLEGLIAALPFPGPDGSLIGIDVGPVVLVPVLLLSLVIGAMVLRPRFVYKTSTPREPAELKVLKVESEASPEPTEQAEATTESSIETELPGVAPPVADEKTVTQLRSLLVEMAVPAPVAEAIVRAGIATITDLVATSPDQLSSMTGMDKRAAEDLHLAVQKKVWFGGI